MEIPIKMDDLGGKTPIFGNTHVSDSCHGIFPPFSTLGRHHGSTTKSCLVNLFGSERKKREKLWENWTHLKGKLVGFYGFINFDVKKPGTADSALQMATLCLIRNLVAGE